jgi:hypothetical protein
MVEVPKTNTIDAWILCFVVELFLSLQVQVGVSFFFTNGEQKPGVISQYQPK